MKIVLIRNNVVVNYLIVDQSDLQEKIDFCEKSGYIVVQNDTAEIGWTYQNGALSPPSVEPSQNLPEAIPGPFPALETDERPVPKYITKLAFRNRFTAAEKINIELAALDNPTATAQQRQNAALIRVYLKDVDAATFIDLDRQDTKDGVQNLETVGLLAAGRANTILTAEIQSTERYRG